MCTIDYKFDYRFERIINLTPGPSGLYATLNTKIIERNTREKKAQR